MPRIIPAQSLCFQLSYWAWVNKLEHIHTRDSSVYIVFQCVYAGLWAVCVCAPLRLADVHTFSVWIDLLASVCILHRQACREHLQYMLMSSWDLWCVNSSNTPETTKTEVHGLPISLRCRLHLEISGKLAREIASTCSAVISVWLCLSHTK